MPSVLLIRHGQASFGAARYDALSEIGTAQAAAVGRELRRRGAAPDVAVSGAHDRQQQTAQAIGIAPRLDARWNEYPTDWILERHHGGARLEPVPGERQTVSSRTFQHALDEALGRWTAVKEDGAGSWRAFARRVDSALEELWSSLAKGERAVVFTSGGPIAAASSAAIHAPDAFVPLNRVLVNGGITTLVRGRGGTTLLTFNEQTHLPGSLLTYR